jgi:hypothetical protein
MKTPALLLAALIAPAAFAAGDAARPISFEVFLDDRPIGYQRFELHGGESVERVESRAQFAVKLLGITAFAYDHRNVEDWRGGCLQAIESSTDSNGTRHAVAGRVADGVFVVDAGSGTRRLGDCVGSFAYWDKRKLLGRRQLLNPQTGEYQPVQLLALGEGTLRLGGREWPVERYALRGEGLDITLAYARGGEEWMALDSKVAGGRTLQYRRAAAELPRGNAP